MKVKINVIKSKEETAPTAHNRPVTASPLRRLGVQSARSVAYGSLPRLLHPHLGVRSCCASPYVPAQTSVTAGTLCAIFSKIVENQ